MSEALVNRLATSESFRMSIDTKNLIRDNVQTYTPQMLRTLEESVARNRQVREAFGVPGWINQLVEQEAQ